MKDLTAKEWETAPMEIKNLHLRAYMKLPTGCSTYENAIKEFPEYFPDEVEYSKKWNAIPQEVHDAYLEEYNKIEEMFFCNIPHKGAGMMFFAKHPDAHKEFNKAWIMARNKSLPFHESLHNKYYSKYGIKWNGI
jgi:hypothetical protein